MASFYGIQTPTITKANKEEIVLVPEKLPIVKIDFSRTQLQLMIQQLPTVLSKTEAYFTMHNEKKHSFNALKHQFRQSEKRLNQLQGLLDKLQEPSKDNLLKFYGEFSFYLEFILQKVPFKEKGTLLEQISIHNNKIKDLTDFTERLSYLFKECFQLQVPIKRSNYPMDELGVSADSKTISYYIFTGFDVLYNYPTLFKHQDIPSMVYNIASFIQPEKDKGKTKSMITQLAYERVMLGMALQQNPQEVFKFSFKPQYKFKLSNYALPLLDTRQRFMVYFMEQYEILTSNKELSKRQFGKFLVCRFADKQSKELDFSHIPIQAFFLKDVKELEDLVASIHDYRAYHEILLQQFLKRREELT